MNTTKESHTINWLTIYPNSQVQINILNKPSLKLVETVLFKPALCFSIGLNKTGLALVVRKQIALFNSTNRLD